MARSGVIVMIRKREGRLPETYKTTTCSILYETSTQISHELISEAYNQLVSFE